MTRDDLFNTNATIVKVLSEAAAKYMILFKQNVKVILQYVITGHVPMPFWLSYVTL